MTEPIRVTAEIIGTTTFHRTPCTIEWTEEGRLRVVATPRDQQPIVVLDESPSGIRRVAEHTASKPQLVITPHSGPTVRISFAGSRRVATEHAGQDAGSAGADGTSQDWWARSLAANGVQVATWGAAKTWSLLGAVAVVTAVAVILIVRATGGF